MRIILISLVFAGLGLAQQVHTVCYRTVDTTTKATSERCVTLSPGLRGALNDWNKAQGKVVTVSAPDVTPPVTEVQGVPYKGPSDMVFSTLQDKLFAPALEQFPTPAMTKAIQAKATAASLAQAQFVASQATEKEAALPVKPATEP